MKAAAFAGNIAADFGHLKAESFRIGLYYKDFKNDL
jgi:hypothetical protein